MSCLFVVCGFALLYLAGAKIFEPLDIQGVFRRVGTNGKCPASVTHAVVSQKTGTDQLVVEHEDISIVQEECSNNGRLTISPFTANVKPPRHGLNLYRQLLSDGSEFYTASDNADRVCNDYTIPNSTIYFFANTNSRLKLTRVKGVTELVPRNDYMVYAESGGNRCVFKANEKPKTERKRVCFPADATVQIEGGKTKRMDVVNVGDSVLAAPGMYSKVFMFTHRDPNFKAEFVELRLQSGAAVQLTPGHYIYSNGLLTAARDVQIGDALTLGDGSMSNVISIKRVEKRGIFNPQTLHGNIVVGGITASTFTKVVEPKVAQTLLAPLRCLYRVLGIHSSFIDGGLTIFDL